SGIGAGPAALDIIDAEAVQRTGDAGLFVSGEGDALGLLPVTQRGIVEVEALGGHGSILARRAASKSEPVRHSVDPPGRSMRTTPAATSPSRSRSASAKSRCARASSRLPTRRATSPLVSSSSAP